MSDPKYINAEKLKRHYAWWDDEAKKIFDEIIDLQPAADVVEVRHGRWMDHSDEWDGGYYECSVCGEAFAFIEGTPKENLYNYCPNCGARMEATE